MKMRTTPRKRRALPGFVVTVLLRPLYRRSQSRQDGSYILRGIGSRHGPVLVVRRKPTPPHP